MRIFLNGREMKFSEQGYEYVFLKPYNKHMHETIKKDHGELKIQLYDNGVQIRTLITESEITTLINRDIAVDTKNNKVYILEADSKIKENPDGSIEVLT